MRPPAPFVYPRIPSTLQTNYNILSRDSSFVTPSRSAVDFVLFNICWLANLYSALHSILWIGPTVTVVALAIHLFPDNNGGRESVILLFIVLSGYGWDTCLQWSGLMTFPLETAVIPPLWLFSQWFALGLIFRDTLRWLRRRYLLAALLGGTGGPLSYYSASGFGIIIFGEPTGWSLLVMGLGWAFLVPLFLFISGEIRGKPMT
jgi:hypothetical protein